MSETLVGPVSAFKQYEKGYVVTLGNERYSGYGQCKEPVHAGDVIELIWKQNGMYKNIVSFSVKSKSPAGENASPKVSFLRQQGIPSTMLLSYVKDLVVAQVGAVGSASNDLWVQQGSFWTAEILRWHAQIERFLKENS